MIMKTKLWSLLVILFVGFAVASCSSDDKDGDEAGNSETSESLFGRWKLEEDADAGGFVLYMFKSNGTGSVKEIGEYDEVEASFTYSYDAKSKILTINWSYEPEEFLVTFITSKTIVLSDENGDRETWTKQ